MDLFFLIAKNKETVILLAKFMNIIQTQIQFSPVLIRKAIRFIRNSILLSFLFCLHCDPAKYENPCSPNSSYFQRTFQLKIILGDKSSFCGVSSADPLLNNSSANTGSSTNTGNSNPTGNNPANTVTPPTSLSYPQNFYTFTQGVSIVSVTPAITGTVTSCAANPVLPVGLFIDNATCAITGTPSVGTALIDYVITASNSAGSVSATLKLRSLFGTAKFAYVPNFSTNNISVYTVNPNTGILTAGPTVGFGSGTRDIAVDPSGKYLYVIGNTSNNIQLYLINNTNGDLIPSGSALATGTGPNSVTVDPTGKFVYVANASGTISCYKADPTTGLLTAGANAPAGATTRWIRVAPSGRYAYVVNGGANNMYIYSIDPISGSLTQVGVPIITGNDPRSVAISPDGRFLFTAELNANQVTPYSINLATGAVTPGSFITFANAPESVFVHPTGKYVYAAYSAGGTIGTVVTNSINFTTGAITAGTSASSGGIMPNRIIVDPSGKFAYSSSYNGNNITLYNLDPTNGNITLVTSYSPGTNPNGIFVTGGNP
ncbi:MAG: beta-propeller fold lactonase family protein [Leptospiraceae bacterium]|nr:beta-propeller fold lactonase family protein [Leptospiraceae bacterium]MBK9503395.1 beta-propeller fold lactonase family protein [Leptospiraceae bacterium]